MSSPLSMESTSRPVPLRIIGANLCVLICFSPLPIFHSFFLIVPLDSTRFFSFLSRLSLLSLQLNAQPLLHSLGGLIRRHGRNYKGAFAQGIVESVFTFIHLTQ